MRLRVNAARALQTSRFSGTNIVNNAQMRPRDIRQFCPLDSNVQALLRTAIDQLSLSARAFDRILKLSRTIADLENSVKLPIITWRKQSNTEI